MEFLRTDAIFMEAFLQQKTIIGFLDGVFGFLLRNTDFYQYKTDNNYSITIEKRDREFLVLTAMSRYDPASSLTKLYDKNLALDDIFVPPAAEEVEIETEGMHKNTVEIPKPIEEMSEGTEQMHEDTEEIHEENKEKHLEITKDIKELHEKTEIIEEEMKEIHEDSKKINEDTEEKQQQQELQEENSDISPALDELKIKEVKKVQNTQDRIVADKKTVSKVEQKSISKIHGFSPADYKNGSCFPHYCWAQTQTDLELHVKLPSDLSSSKLILIDIKADKILVRSRSDPNDVIISGQLSKRVKHKDVVWTINEEKLTICLDKRSHVWWERLFCGEEPIDVKKIDCERYIDELPEDSQAAIQKIQLQQMEQNNQTNEPEIALSNEEKLERLRKAWDAEGSPFKGQPFDPSFIKFS